MKKGEFEAPEGRQGFIKFSRAHHFRHSKPVKYLKVSKLKMDVICVYVLLNPSSTLSPRTKLETLPSGSGRMVASRHLPRYPKLPPPEEDILMVEASEPPPVESATSKLSRFKLSPSEEYVSEASSSQVSSTEPPPVESAISKLSRLKLSPSEEYVSEASSSQVSSTEPSTEPFPIKLIPLLLPPPRCMSPSRCRR